MISNERIIEPDMTTHENKILWLYPRWWLRKIKVTQKISVLQYLKCLWMRYLIPCISIQEVELNKKRPLYIKAKEKTAHMIKKLDAGK